MNDDERLLSHVHPPDWRNPDPAPMYDLVVLGGGTAGLVCAAGAAGLGARVALIERALLGGDCLNTGCVPSKALLRSARVMAETRVGGSLGVSAAAEVDFAAVMSRLRARRADIAPHDSAARLASLGVDVFFGSAAFTGPRSVKAGSATLRFRKAVIATGGRPSQPPVSGLDSVPYLTSETVFSLGELPRELIVLGAGPIGCELAQAFALLGSRVMLLDSASQVLPREDPDAAAIVSARLDGDGVFLRLGATVTSVSGANGRVTVTLSDGSVSADTLLVATGRAPNLERLGLHAAGVAHDETGLQVDDRLRTTNPRVYAAGDVCSRFQFTHAADAMARIVIQNALFFGRKRASAVVIPWCTYTSPEVAHVGIAPGDIPESGVQTVTVTLDDVDRSVVDEEIDGFVKVHHRGGRIHGATIVAPHAGEIIGLVAHLMQHGGSLGDLSATVFPYPTVAMALRQAADTYRRGSVTPAVRRLLHYYFKVFR